MNSKAELQLLLQFAHLFPEAEGWSQRLAVAPCSAMGELSGQRHSPLRLGLILATQPNPTHFPFGLSDNERGEILPVLGAPRLSLEMKDFLTRQGWGWLDAAGNCRIQGPESYPLRLEREGRKPEPLAKTAKARALSLRALQTTRLLLADVGRRWTLRDLLAAHLEDSPESIQASLGWLQGYIKSLTVQNFLRTCGSGRSAGFRVADPKGLLLKLAKEDAGAERFKIRKFFLLPQKWEVFLAELSVTALASAYSAADLMAPYVQQRTQWLSAAARHESSIREALIKAGGREVESGENLCLMLSLDPGFSFRPSLIQGRRCCHPVQTCWDLYKLGGRAAEAADFLVAEYLMPKWQQALNSGDQHG